MSKKKKALVVAFVVMGVAVLGLAAAVYAKYIASFTANGGGATVAKWAFEGDNESSTVSCDLSKTYNPATLVNDKIAPGTEGYCEIELVNTNSEVGVKYTIKPSGVNNKPTNLKFYKDENYTTELDDDGITGNLNANQSTAQKATIYWKWDYETSNGDTADTTDGEAAKTMTVSFDVSGVQVQPTVQQQP